MFSLSEFKMAPAKKMLLMSLFDLLEETPLDGIPTKGIYERVGISANAFYYHFQDKYDCASWLFRVMLTKAMGGFSDPEHFYDAVSDMRGTKEAVRSLDENGEWANPADEANPLAYSVWMEKWHPMWYSMSSWVRGNARMQFVNIYGSREAGSPYFELRGAWDRYFLSIVEGCGLENERRREFLKEALFSFFELYLFDFALNPDYDFQESDAKLLMKIRCGLYATCIEQQGA